MKEKEFNLLDEPWIRVISQDLSEQKVSLLEVLIHARSYRTLAGEMATQDAAILRLLLACVQSVFYRYDADGIPDEIDQDVYAEYVMDRWKAYWEAKALPERAVTAYFETYRERFWLFHPQTPFYQVADLEYGTDFGAQGLYGNIRASNNIQTKHHFSQCEGDELRNMPYDEAARWLVHLSGYCVNIKNKAQAPGTQNPAGVGRLGRLGLIYADGRNLFETLMLNLTPLRTDDTPWGAPKPVWEIPLRKQQSIEIALPDNLPALYTLQSRRICLRREEEKVVGLRVLNGDYCTYENAFTEPMTVWRRIEDKKTQTITYLPKTFSPDVQVWREFPTIFYASSDEKTNIPGVVQWMGTLQKEVFGRYRSLVTFRTAGMVYGDKMSYTYGDCISDAVTLSAELLKSFSGDWMARICDEIRKCELTADSALRIFAQRIAAVMNDDPKRRASDLKARFYAQIDHPFRDWLMSIRPAEEKKEDAVYRWEKNARRCAQSIAADYAASLQQDLCRIRETEKGELLSVPGAYEACLYAIRRIYPVTEEDK